jgi:hypothetical protein
MKRKLGIMVVFLELLMSLFITAHGLAAQAVVE